MDAAGVLVITTWAMWLDFIEDAGLLNAETPDGFAWRAADKYEMGRLMSELAHD